MRPTAQDLFKGQSICVTVNPYGVIHTPNNAAAAAAAAVLCVCSLAADLTQSLIPENDSGRGNTVHSQSFLHNTS